MMTNEQKVGRIIAVLLIIIILLIGIIAYYFLIKPKINSYVIQKQIEAKDIVISAILQQIQQQGYVQLSFNNQTVTLVPYTPPQK